MSNYYSGLGTPGGPDISNANAGSQVFGGNLGQAQTGNILGAYALGAPDQSNYTSDALAGDSSLAVGQVGQLGQLAVNGGLSDQQNAVNLLQSEASGNGPSAATAAMNQGVAQAQNNANSMAAANRGNGGLGLRNAMNAGAAAAGQAAGQGAIARAQEQIGALGQYNQATQGLTANALGQQSNVINNRNSNVNAINSASGSDKAQLAGTIAYDAARQGYANNGANLLNTVYQEQNGNTPAALQGSQQAFQAAGAGASAVGSLLAAAPALA